MPEPAAVRAQLDRDAFLAPAAIVRREEVVLALTLAVGVALCYASGTGFEWSRIFWIGYARFFAAYALYLFVVARMAHLVRVRWRPAAPPAARALRWLGGPTRPSEIFDTDLEFLRGLGLLLVTLMVYTNVKVRIPFINETVGDDLFQAVDNLMLGERFVPWIERTTAASPWLSDALNRVYFFGHIWMVLLVLWLWIRSDARRMRWLFVSYCLTYMIVIFVTALYPSYGPFFLDWERFGWARETMSGHTQAFLVGRFLESGELVARGKTFVPVAFTGIAAFPSLHVGQMALIAYVAWTPARLFALFMIGVALVTTVATLAFGWHYLVDAVAGAAVAVCIPALVRPWILGQRAATGPSRS